MKTGLGLVFGVLIVGCVHLWNGGSGFDLWQPASLTFVFLGTLLATFLSTPQGRFLSSVLEKSPAVSTVALRKELADLAAIARKEGFLALDPFRGQASRETLKDGIQYLISGFDQSAIRSLFDATLERKRVEGSVSVRLWEVAAAASPSIGALGATLGLLTALAKLDDPSKLGRGISAAMAAVLYGFFFANFLFSPLAARKKKELADSVIPDEMVKLAILSIQEGLNPQLTEERLKQVSQG